MRVTTQMVASNLMTNLDDIRERLQLDQTDLSTGVSVHVPSDGPDKVGLAMQYKLGLRKLDSYDSAMNDSLGWMQTADGNLNQLNNDLQRVRQLALQAANSSNPQQALDSINAEMSGLYQDMLGLMNGQYNGKYLFAGTKIDQPPFVQTTVGGVTQVTYQGDTQPLVREIGPGIKQQVNITGDQLITPQNVLNSILQLQQDLNAGTLTSLQDISQNVLGQLDKAGDTLATQRALLGVRMSQIDTLQSRARDTRVNLQDLLSKDLGTDMEATAMKLALDQNSYQVSLAVGAKIVPPTLVDFLR